MIDSLVMSQKFATFVLASLLLAITPGPGVIYVLTRTLSQGRSAGLASVCGIALGNLANAVLASLGLAVLIASSQAAFMAVKLSGAAYLAFLGVQTLISRPAMRPNPAAKPLTSHGRLWRTAFFVALTNPKTALFFAALLPQFIHPGAAPLAQSLLLSAVFVVLASCTDSLYVFAAAALSPRVRRAARWQATARYLSAATFMGLGLYAALAKARAPQ
jgi:threonine/homoserine/homoserine lactone efflux protein